MRIRSSSTSLLALAALAVSFAVAAPVGRTDDAKPPAPDAAQTAKNEEAAKYFDEVRAKSEKQDENEAKAALAKLLAYWKDKDLTAETKKQIPGLMARYAHPDRITVAVAALDTMSELTPEEGGREVRDVLERSLKSKTPAPELYGACFRALKKLADPSKATTGLLVDLLKRKESDVIGRAADAIAGYKDAAGKVRRDLMEEVLKIGESSFQAAQGGKDGTATTKWNTIKAGVMSALSTLSGQNFPDPLAARRWYNDHKKDAKIWG